MMWIRADEKTDASGWKTSTEMFVSRGELRVVYGATSCSSPSTEEALMSRTPRRTAGHVWGLLTEDVEGLVMCYTQGRTFMNDIHSSDSLDTNV